MIGEITTRLHSQGLGFEGIRANSNARNHARSSGPAAIRAMAGLVEQSPVKKIQHIVYYRKYEKSRIFGLQENSAFVPKNLQSEF